MKRILHIVGTYQFVHRQDADRTEYSHVVAGETNILIRIYRIFGSQIKAVFIIGQR